MSLWNDVRSVAAVLVPLVLAGCGGGGGGGGSGDDRVRYDGKTTKAVITEQNADIVVKGVAGGVPAALDLFGGAGVLFKARAGEAAVAKLALRDLGRLLSKPLRSSLSSSPGARAERRAARTESGSMPGSCGGQVRFEITLEDLLTGAIRGELTFSSDYCDEDVQIAGTLSFTGDVDPFSLDIAELEMSTVRLDVRTTDPKDPMNVSMTGTVGIDAQDSEITLSVALRDNATAQTANFQDFVVTYEDSTDETTLTITGRYYDPSEGYVDYVTEQPLVIHRGDDGPSSGVVTALGAEQGTGETRSRLTALTAETYRIDADLNGNGDYGDAGMDWNSAPLYWSDLGSRL